MEREKITMESVKKLMSFQMKETDKITLADFVIKNNSTRHALKNSIKQFSKILEIL
jgi:dephospho-CoA kinase